MNTVARERGRPGCQMGDPFRHLKKQLTCLHGVDKLSIVYKA